MTQQSKTIIKTYFQTGDFPTETQFANLIDSYQDAATNLGTLSSAGLGTVGLQLLSCVTSASAQNIVGISLPVALNQGGTGVAAATASAAFNAVAAQGGTIAGAVAVSGAASFFSTVSANNNLNVNGQFVGQSLAGSQTVMTASANLTSTQWLVGADMTSGSYPLILPLASTCPGREYTIFKIGASNTLTLTRSGSDIFLPTGGSTLALTNDGATRRLISGGSTSNTWWVVGSI